MGHKKININRRTFLKDTALGGAISCGLVGNVLAADAARGISTGNNTADDATLNFLNQKRAKLLRIMEELEKGNRKMDAETAEILIDCVPNYKIGIKVVSQEGFCSAGHKVDDEWLVKGRGDGFRTPNMCMFAFATIYQSILLLMYGGSFPWEPDPDIVLAPCPDPRNPVVFELKRLGEG